VHEAAESELKGTQQVAEPARRERGITRAARPNVVWKIARVEGGDARCTCSSLGLPVMPSILVGFLRERGALRRLTPTVLRGGKYVRDLCPIDPQGAF
jgi:hypothetical protein